MEIEFFWHCKEQTSGLSAQIELRLAPKQELLYVAMATTKPTDDVR